MCNFSGKLDAAFTGNRLRHICVSEETVSHGEEACRFEHITGLNGFSIVRAHDDTKYFCKADEPLTIGDAEEPAAEIDENGELTQEAKDK